MRSWQRRLAAAGALVAAVLALSAAGPRSPALLRFAPGGRFKLALFAGLGPRAGRRLRPRHGRRARRREARLRGVPGRPRDGQQRAGRQREPLLGPGGLRGQAQGRPVVHGVRQPRRHALRVAAGVVLPRGRPAGALPARRVGRASLRMHLQGHARVELMTDELDRACGLSRSSVGPGELWPGVSNYVLQVLSRERPQDPPLLMYFLDSGGGSYPEVISCAQVAWFHSQARFLNPDGSIPELVFWHIPSTAYVKVAPEAKSEVSKPCVGSLNEEDVAPQVAEWGMMDALARRSSVKAIFVGHNHGLDWCCPYEKLWLCFARHTGHGGYGGWPRGARIVDISDEKGHFSVNSWIRMENGSTHSHITLTSARFS